MLHINFIRVQAQFATNLWPKRMRRRLGRLGLGLDIGSTMGLMFFGGKCAHFLGRVSLCSVLLTSFECCSSIRILFNVFVVAIRKAVESQLRPKIDGARLERT